MRAGTDASDAPAAASPAWTAPSHPPCGKLPAASRPTTDSSLLAQKRRVKKNNTTITMTMAIQCRSSTAVLLMLNILHDLHHGTYLLS